ncbi:hypothetical protein CEXT_215741 [Caerostris extrusa]|uniref:Ankyrin repeat domain-containing protein n=1 Tax=Caerostris extrusa TaxID=172846 RepID=A0AAV4VHY9_CAEEX|nr:hypothetical protein CEXT_215741 [Caerostris extrusa]
MSYDPEHPLHIIDGMETQPFTFSAAMGRSKLTRILLEAGCDQKLRNNQGEMARDIAERKEFTEVIKLLDNPPVTVIHVEQQIKKPTKSSKKREKDSKHFSGQWSERKERQA